MADLRTAAKRALKVLEQLQGGCTDADDGTVEAITVWCPEVISDLRAALEKDGSVTAPPIWETLAEIGESAPAGTWDALPAQKLQGQQRRRGYAAAAVAAERKRLERDVASLHMSQSINNQNYPSAWHDGVDAALEVIRGA